MQHLRKPQNNKKLQTNSLIKGCHYRQISSVSQRVTEKLPKHTNKIKQIKPSRIIIKKPTSYKNLNLTVKMYPLNVLHKQVSLICKRSQ